MKHLQADLSTVFKRQLAELPAVRLPSGPAYIRPMKLSAITANICYSYEIYWYSSSIVIHTHALTTESALRLSRPRFTTSIERFRSFASVWNVHFFDSYTRYFRTIDDVLIDAFIRNTETQTNHPDFSRIKSTYPEYFI